MPGPYELGKRYVMRVRDHQQSLFATVAEVYDHELVLVDVRVGPIRYERLVVGRAAVNDALLVAAPKPTGTEDTDKVGADGRRVTVQG